MAEEEGAELESFGKTAANISLIVARAGLKGTVESTEETGGITLEDPVVTSLLTVVGSNITTPGVAEEVAG